MASSYLIRPSPIHSRKLFMHRANSVRYVDHSQQKQPHLFSGASRDSKQSTGSGPGRDQAGPPAGGTNAMYEIVAQPGPDEQHAEATQHDQQAKTLKSYFSDGDFSEVMIKINDHDDLNDHQQRPRTPSFGNNAQHQPDDARPGDAEWLKRRRSSCSDAGDSKRSSLSHENVPF